MKAKKILYSITEEESVQKQKCNGIKIWRRWKHNQLESTNEYSNERIKKKNRKQTIKTKEMERDERKKSVETSLLRK